MGRAFDNFETTTKTETKVAKYNFFINVGEDYLREMWAYICPELLVAIEREPEESVTPEMMESFAKVKRICYI